MSERLLANAQQPTKMTMVIEGYEGGGGEVNLI